MACCPKNVVPLDFPTETLKTLKPRPPIWQYMALDNEFNGTALDNLPRGLPEGSRSIPVARRLKAGFVD